MRCTIQLLKCAVASLGATVFFAVAALADDAELEALFAGLQTAETEAAQQIESRIYQIWSQSGSPAMDLLLERGREALNAGDPDSAIWHFTALIDHAPDFAEGYNARATAYFQKGRFGPTLEDVRQTLILNPRHFGALSGLALVLEEIERPAAALQAWREVEKLYPNRDGLDDAVRRLSRRVEGAEL